MLRKYILKHKLFFILFVLLILASSVAGALAGNYLKRHTSDKSPDIPIKINTFTINTCDVSNEAAYSGEIRSRYESELSFQTEGKIIARNIQPGSIVRKGDILFRLDARDLQQSVKSSLAQESSTRAQLDLAAKNMHRYGQLFEEGAVSKAEYDQYKEQYKTAAAAVSQAESQYAQSSNQLSYSDLTAPYDGVITSVNAETGQVISSGQSIASIAQPTELEIEFDVPESKIADLSAGEKASVTFWAFPDVKTNAVIREITPFADNITRTFKVRASLLQPLPAVKLGMTAVLTISQTAKQPVIRIPMTAVYQSENNGSGVWLIRDAKLSFQPISLGELDDDKKVSVLSGLSPGDCIAATGVNKLYEGEPVEKGDTDS